MDKLTLSDESGRAFPLTSASKQALYAIPGRWCNASNSTPSPWS